MLSGIEVYQKSWFLLRAVWERFARDDNLPPAVTVTFSKFLYVCPNFSFFSEDINHIVLGLSLYQTHFSLVTSLSTPSPLWQKLQQSWLIHRLECPHFILQYRFVSFQNSFNVAVILGGIRWWFKYLSLCHPEGRHQKCSRFLALVWPTSPSLCRHLSWEPENVGISFPNSSLLLPVLYVLTRWNIN